MRRRIILISILIAVLLGCIFFLAKQGIVKRLDNIAYNPNALIRHFAPTWGSFKKIIDLPYTIRALPYRSTLPVYDIRLTKNDRINLLNALPDFPEENRLYEEFKNKVKAEFRFGSYRTNDAKVRYRGRSPNHWYALKKSWHVTLPDDAPLGKRTDFRFFLPDDRGWVEPFLWNHIRTKLNLLTLEATPVRLRVNEKNYGLYTLVEGWEESTFERQQRIPGRIFSDRNIDRRGETGDLFSEKNIQWWYDRSESSADGITPPEKLLPLQYLLHLTDAADNATFEREIENIIDMDYFLRWTFVATLSGNFHPGNNRENINLYLNPATGKFELISPDMNITRLPELGMDLSNNRLANRVLQTKKYRDRFDDIARAYLTDETLNDDLTIYDQWAPIIRNEAFQDSMKETTSRDAANAIRESRNIYEANFKTLKARLEETGHVPLQITENPLATQKPQVAATFATWKDISQSRASFLARHRTFLPGINPMAIMLPAGIHYIEGTVIIPKDLTLTIAPGTTILMGPNASLLSYGSINAAGTAEMPIHIMRAALNVPWGIFGIINTPRESVFNFITVDGGKDATINGIYFSGIFTARNAPFTFRNGVIAHAEADDGLHAVQSPFTISGNRFVDNAFDQIDIDLDPAQSEISNNYFTVTDGKNNHINGDAMDVSFSSTRLIKNTVDGCGDKGISIGEMSAPQVSENIIMGCTIGIAVKDASEAYIEHTTLIKNEVGLSLYRKKLHFERGGTAHVTNSTLWENGIEIEFDKVSSIDISKSTVENGFSGIDIRTTPPNLKQLIPSWLISKYKLAPHE